MGGDERVKETSQMYWCLPNVPFLPFHSVELPERVTFIWPSFPHSSSTPQSSSVQLPFLPLHWPQLQCGPLWPTCYRIHWTILNSPPNYSLTCSQHYCYKILLEALYSSGHQNTALLPDHFLLLTSWPCLLNLPRLSLLCSPSLKWLCSPNSILGLVLIFSHCLFGWAH